jgi:hypothetical protein
LIGLNLACSSGESWLKNSLRACSKSCVTSMVCF